MINKLILNLSIRNKLIVVILMVAFSVVLVAFCCIGKQGVSQNTAFDNFQSGDQYPSGWRILYCTPIFRRQETGCRGFEQTRDS